MALCSCEIFKSMLTVCSMYIIVCLWLHTTLPILRVLMLPRGGGGGRGGGKQGVFWQLACLGCSMVWGQLLSKQSVSSAMVHL